MTFIPRSIIFLAVIPLIVGYSSGPPVSSSTTLCVDMVPQHGYSAQTGVSKFEVITNTNECYNENIQIQVVVRTKSGYSAYIEGLFVQARESGSTSTTGTYTVTDSVLSALTCVTANSAVGHNKEVKATFRDMTWTPEPGTRARPDVNITATVVEHKDIFWVGVQSLPLKYDTNCVANALLSDTQSGATVTLPSVLVLMLTACLAKFMQL